MRTGERGVEQGGCAAATWSGRTRPRVTYRLAAVITLCPKRCPAGTQPASAPIAVGADTTLCAGWPGKEGCGRQRKGGAAARDRLRDTARGTDYYRPLWWLEQGGRAIQPFRRPVSSHPLATRAGEGMLGGGGSAGTGRSPRQPVKARASKSPNKCTRHKRNGCSARPPSSELTAERVRCLQQASRAGHRVRRA